MKNDVLTVLVIALIIANAVTIYKLNEVSKDIKPIADLLNGVIPE